MSYAAKKVVMITGAAGGPGAVPTDMLRGNILPGQNEAEFIEVMRARIIRSADSPLRKTSR